MAQRVAHADERPRYRGGRHAVDSLLNFETVKYFGAEEREARRYDGAMAAYANAAVKSENSLAWLNIGQAVITNVMLGGGMAFVAWGWGQARFSAGDVVFVSTLLSQLFRPLDLLGMVYRTIRQGVIDMGAMFDLVDTRARSSMRPTRSRSRSGAGMSGSRMCASATIPACRSSRGSTSTSRRGRRSRWSGRRARASRRSRG